jgi:hypothetical protein
VTDIENARNPTALGLALRLLVYIECREPAFVHDMVSTISAFFVTPVPRFRPVQPVRKRALFSVRKPAFQVWEVSRERDDSL